MKQIVSTVLLLSCDKQPCEWQRGQGNNPMAPREGRGTGVPAGRASTHSRNNLL